MRKLLKKGCLILSTAAISLATVAQNQEAQSKTTTVLASSETGLKANDASKYGTPDLENVYKNYFEKRKSAMYYLDNLQASTDFLFYAKKFSKKEFIEKKNEYRTKGGIDDYVFDLISKQEEFYTTTVPTKTIETINAFLKSQEEKKNLTKNSAKEAINACNVCLDYIEGVLLLNPENAYYTEMKLKNENQKKEIEKSVASGDYEKTLANRTPEQINAVQLNTAQMTEIYAEWATSEGLLNANLGTALAISITSKQWKIKKDNAGAILYKYVDVETIAKNATGKCYKVTGTVTKAYEQEATYAKPVFNYEYKEEMNCEKLVEKKQM